ncbi:uncharacterized protein LOC118756950 [Rhagoletis pomonella]|uniref:uncharacterized protein LOC118756950 n=1 Tax=Rhagoletis pomonella TaxID=28610 RepID=UPI00177ADCE7|nr:uncharacterized protein LOC118756950 [Rhagoletis pomonella]
MGYKSSRRFLAKLRERDPATLTPRDKAIQKKHAYIVRKYERLREDKVSNASGSEAAVSGKATNSDKRDAATKPPSEGGSSLPTKKAASLSAVGNNKPSQSLTPKVSNTARPVFPRLDGEKASTSAAAIASGGRGPVARTPKRQLSGDKKIQPEQKRVKTSSTLCSAPELQVAIIDRNHPEGKIPMDKWLPLEEKIMRALLGEIQRTKNNNIGMFDGAKWQKGVKVVGCGNKESLDFLTNCVRNQDELWANARLEVVPLSEVPSRTTVRVWIPPPLVEDETSLALIKCQNVDVIPDDWTIVRGRARDKGNGKDLWIKIGPQSLQILRRKAGQIRYGIGHLRVIIPDAERESEKPKGGAD